LTAHIYIEDLTLLGFNPDADVSKAGASIVEAASWEGCGPHTTSPSRSRIMAKMTRPLWEVEQERERKAHAQLVREAAELLKPKRYAPKPVEARPEELYRVEVRADAFRLWHHLNEGADHLQYGPAPTQTDEQLAETLRHCRGSEEVVALLEELQQKGLLRIEERKGKRFINTTTARTCGL
jgi:hypothetical protein